MQVFKTQVGQCPGCGSSMSSELSASGVFMREGTKAREDGVIDIDVD